MGQCLKAKVREGGGGNRFRHSQPWVEKLEVKGWWAAASSPGVRPHRATHGLLAERLSFAQ